MDWIGRDGVRRASINSFGYGGSNAHAIIQNYTPRGRQQITDLLDPDMVGKRPYLLPLTAHSENAGKIWISKLEKYLDGKHEISATDLAYSLSSRRSMHRYRSFAIGHDQISIIKSLKNPGPTQTWTQKLEQKPRLGFIFTGTLCCLYFLFLVVVILHIATSLDCCSRNDTYKHTKLNLNRSRRTVVRNGQTAYSRRSIFSKGFGAMR